MAERVTVSVFEQARAELQLAWERRHRAQRELAAFLARHHRIRRDDVAGYERELHALRIEVDDSTRQHQHAREEFLRQQKLANSPGSP